MPLEYSLIECVTNNNLTELEKLLNEGADINVEDANGNNLLSLAIKGFSTNFHIVQLLLKRGAKPGNENIAGRVLSFALRNDQYLSGLHNQETSIDLAKVAIDNGAYISESYIISLATKQSTKMLGFLVDKIIDLPKDELIRPYYKDYSEKLKILFAKHPKQTEAAAALFNKLIIQNIRYSGIGEEIQYSKIEKLIEALDMSAEDLGQLMINAISSKEEKIAILLLNGGANPRAIHNDDYQPALTNKSALTLAKQIGLNALSEAIENKLLSIEDILFIAQKIKLPYLNLTHKIYSLEESSSETILKRYKEMKLKSLYLRVDKVSLNEEQTP